MPSEPKELTVVTLCDYLTEVGIKWRPVDHNALKMVKALKGDDINGSFCVKISGQVKTYTQTNYPEFVKLIPNAMIGAIRAHYDSKATLVPIPNSHVVSPHDENFKTLELARAIAELSNGQFNAIPALVFKQPQLKARKGGTRSPYALEKLYKITAPVQGPIILIDDVLTLGGHIIGAFWKLHSENRPVVLGCTFGSTTKEQSDKPLSKKVQTLSVEKDIEEFF